MRAFVEFRHMAATLSLPSTRAQLDAISAALTELQSKEPRKRDAALLDSLFLMRRSSETLTLTFPAQQDLVDF